MRHIWDNLAVFQFGFTANTLAAGRVLVHVTLGLRRMT